MARKIFFYDRLCKLIDYNCESRKNQSPMVIARLGKLHMLLFAINLRFQFLPAIVVVFLSVKLFTKYLYPIVMC